MLFILPVALQNIQLAYYQARKRVKQVAKLQVIIKTFSLLFIIFFTYHFRLNGYIITIVCTGFIALIILKLGLDNIRLNLGYFILDVPLLKKMWNIAGYALFANTISVLIGTMDIYLINYLITDRTEIGFYMFALTIVSVYQILPASIQQVSFPFFSEQSVQHEKWYRSFLKYNKLNHILVLLVVACGILFFPVIIKIAFLGKYDRSIYYFIFLSIAWLIKYLNTVKSTALMGYGRFDINFKASLITLILTFPSIFLLVINFKLTGALIGMILGSIISYSTTSWFFYKFHKKMINQSYNSNS